MCQNDYDKVRATFYLVILPMSDGKSAIVQCVTTYWIENQNKYQVKTNNKFYYLSSTNCKLLTNVATKKYMLLKFQIRKHFLSHDPQKADRLIVQTFMKELFRRNEEEILLVLYTRQLMQCVRQLKQSGATQQVKDAAPETIETIRKASSSRKKLKSK